MDVLDALADFLSLRVRAEQDSEVMTYSKQHCGLTILLHHLSQNLCSRSIESSIAVSYSDIFLFSPCSLLNGCMLPRHSYQTHLSANIDGCCEKKFGIGPILVGTPQNSEKKLARIE